MLDTIVRIFEPKPFRGTVVDVQLVDGYIDRHDQYVRYSKQPITEIVGHDQNGVPIKDTYIHGLYRITVVNSHGKAKQFLRTGKPPKIGSQYESR